MGLAELFPEALQKTFGWAEDKPNSHVPTRVQHTHTHTHTHTTNNSNNKTRSHAHVKIMQPIPVRVRQPFKHQDNPVCTKSVRVFEVSKFDTIPMREESEVKH